MDFSVGFPSVLWEIFKSSSLLGVHGGVWTGIRGLILLMDKKLILKYSGDLSMASALSQGMRH